MGAICLNIQTAKKAVAKPVQIRRRSRHLQLRITHYELRIYKISLFINKITVEIWIFLWYYRISIFFFM